MANPEFKNPSSASSLNNPNPPSSGSNLRDALRDPKAASERLISEANPRIRETIDQVSEVASDLYGRANTWLGQGNNRNYSFVAAAATAGLIGFFIGRSMRSNSSEF